MVGYGGEQSLDRYLAISARGVPFNVAHAVGNVVLALAAGPALVRMIARFRERFEFRWREAGAAPLALAARDRPGDRLASAASAHAAAPSAVGVARGRAERRRRIRRRAGDSSSATMTGWAALGLEAAGRSPFAVRNGGRDADRLPAARGGRPEVGRRPRAHDPGAGGRGRQLAPFRAAGTCRRTFAPGAPAAARSRGRSTSPRSESWRCAPRERRGPRWAAPLGGCAARRTGTGAGAFSPAPPSDADSTGAALQGLAAAGATRHTHAPRRAYLRRRRSATAGSPWRAAASRTPSPPRGRSRGWSRPGVSPSRVREHGHSPLDYLSARQRGDGHYTYSASSDQTPVWVTGQALVAAKREAFSAAAGAAAGAAPALVGGRGSRGSERVRLRFRRRLRHDGDRPRATSGGGASGGRASSQAGGRGAEKARASGPAPLTAAGASPDRRADSREGPGRRAPLGAAVDPAAPPPGDGDSQRSPTSSAGSRRSRSPWRPASSGTAAASPDGSSLHWIPCRRWRSRPRSAPGGRTRRSSPSPSSGRCSTSCSSSPGGRPTTTSPTRGASGSSARGRWSA